jgi:GT2 family glycosyltransferase
MNRIAVLLTCFNRVDTTLRCLEELLVLNQEVDVYLVDDNSSDGTLDAVLINFPKVNVINGDGNLFWNRGMHLAWEYAKKKGYSYYLWLNDDVILYRNCFVELFECSRLSENNSIISGLIESHNKEKTLYGGTDKYKKLLISSGVMQAVTNMNGNVVLIPASVFAILGNLDPVFHHDLGDVDYGLRAIENGVGVFTTRVAIGSCDENDVCRVRLWNSSLLKRFQRLYSPLGNNPVINFYFRRRHYGVINAAIYFIYIHLLNLMPNKFVYFLFKNKYGGG